MNNSIKKICTIVLLGFLMGATDGSLSGPHQRMIRVAVLRAQAEVSLSVAGPFEVGDAVTRAALWKSSHLSTVKVRPLPGGIKLGVKIFSTDSLLITDHRPAGIIVNKRPYRGDVVITKDKDGTLLVVNIVDLESYVKGVLYHEISNKWPMDAIKAQAVATRTFALYQQEAMKAQPYDVTADTSSQVYGGYASEKNKTNRGVNFTAGEVLLYEGRIFPAYFHATCGGLTENASELWNNDIEPLRGGRACTYCLSSPHYFWKSALPLSGIRQKLGAGYTLTGSLADIVVTERTAMGRAKTIELIDDTGATEEVMAKDLRRLVGPDVMRSTNFSVVTEGGSAHFTGKGWGHGVGLCQWGAKGMASKGFSYVDILKFYYPGSTVSKVK